MMPTLTIRIAKQREMHIHSLISRSTKGKEVTFTLVRALVRLT